MNALVKPIAACTLTRPIFQTAGNELMSPIQFANANWDALVAWYVAIANEIRDTGEQMPDFVDFVAIQLDIERAMKGMPIYTPAKIDESVTCEREREPRREAWEDRTAREVGVRRFGEI